jgi:hypothetical protein
VCPDAIADEVFGIRFGLGFALGFSGKDLHIDGRGHPRNGDLVNKSFRYSLIQDRRVCREATELLIEITDVGDFELVAASVAIVA